MTEKPRDLAKRLGIQLWTPVYRKGKGVGMQQTDDGSYIEVGELPKAVVPANEHPQAGLSQEQRERLERMADRIERAANRRGVTAATEEAHADAELLRSLATEGGEQ